MEPKPAHTPQCSLDTVLGTGHDYQLAAQGDLRVSTIMYTNRETESYMREALKEATLALSEGNPPIGAVVVREGRIIARGRNRRQSNHFLRHAEIEAIFSMNAPGQSREATTIYTTVEPCYLCFGAILAARIGHIVFAAPDALSGCRQIKETGLYSRSRIFTLEGGILEHESFTLLYGYSSEFCQLLFGTEFARHRELLPPG